MSRPDITALIDVGANNRKTEKPRSYIGASVIGTDCLAEISLYLRGFPDSGLASRMSRIFRDGHKIEDSVISDLKHAGIHIFDRDPVTSRQWAFSAFGETVVGHADGITDLDDETLLVEIKSMNDARWKEFKKNGVKSSHKKYFAQVQFMMGLSGIASCVLIAYNKNTSEYHHQYIDFDDIYYSFLMSKTETVLNGINPRISTDSNSFNCRFCFKRESCIGSNEVEPDCRRCAHASVDKADCSWSCHREYGTVCDEYQRFLPR